MPPSGRLPGSETLRREVRTVEVQLRDGRGPSDPGIRPGQPEPEI